MIQMQPIIVIHTIDNQQKKIVIKQEHEFSTIYHVWIDNTFEAEVHKGGSGDGVYPHVKSWLKADKYKDVRDLIFQTILNAENHNS